jgi:hypothetical protein
VARQNKQHAAYVSRRCTKKGAPLPAAEIYRARSASGRGLPCRQRDEVSSGRSRIGRRPLSPGSNVDRDRHRRRAPPGAPSGSFPAWRASVARRDSLARLRDVIRDGQEGYELFSGVHIRGGPEAGVTPGLPERAASPEKEGYVLLFFLLGQTEPRVVQQLNRKRH